MRLVEDGVPVLAQRILARPAGSAVLGWGQRRPDTAPLRIAEVGRICGSCHTQARSQTSCQFLHTL